MRPSDLPVVAPAALTPETPARLIACDRMRAKMPARTCLGLQALGTTECAGCSVGCAVRLALGVPKPKALAAKEALVLAQAKAEEAARAKALRVAAKRAAVALKRPAPPSPCSTEGCNSIASEAPAKTPEAVGKCKRCRRAISHARHVGARSKRPAPKSTAPLCARCGKRPRAKAWASRPVAEVERAWCTDCKSSARRARSASKPRALTATPRVVRAA